METRITLHLLRFWLVAFLLSSVFILTFLQACVNKVAVSPHSPLLGFWDSHYLLHNVDPLVLVLCQLAVGFLAFDSTHRHKRASILEPLESRPIRNITFLGGRVVAFSMCIWMVVIVIFMLCQVVLWTSNFTELQLGELISIDDAVDIFAVKLPLYLLFACAIALFFASMAKSRMTSMLMLLLFFVVEYLVLSGVVTELTNESSISLIFARELTYISEVSSFIKMLDIAAIVLLTVGLCFVSSIVYKRLDDTNTQSTTAFPGLCILTGRMFAILSSCFVLSDQFTYDNIKLARKRVPGEVHTKLESMKGVVEIDPGKLLSIDLKYALTLSENTNSILLSFNPGMNITRITVDKIPVDYRFQDGILALERHEPWQKGERVEFAIQADGNPNTGFAYLDASLRYEKNSDVTNPLQAVHGYGSSDF